MTVPILIGIYIFFIAIVLRLIIPHLGFRKSDLPKSIPRDFQSKIEELDRKSKTNLIYLKNAYEFLTIRFHGSRVKTLTRFWYAFGDVFRFKSGFLPCTSLNYLLRIMLIKSGRFKEDDIKLIIVPFNFIIHQHLKVKVNHYWINVDPWSRALGVPFGKRSFLFG